MLTFKSNLLYLLTFTLLVSGCQSPATSSLSPRAVVVGNRATQRSAETAEPPVSRNAVSPFDPAEVRLSDRVDPKEIHNPNLSSRRPHSEIRRVAYDESPVKQIPTRPLDAIQLEQPDLVKNKSIDSAEPKKSIQMVAYHESTPAKKTRLVKKSSFIKKTPAKDELSENAYPIDLANALGLASANSLQIELARERVLEAVAQMRQADFQWLPSLRGGVGFNKHDGQLQATNGTVLPSNRQSVFVGGGAGLGNSTLAGGSGGPARLMVNLSLADAFFEPLVAERLVDAADAAETSTMNDELLAVAEAYFSLVEAHGLLAGAQQGLHSSTEMHDLIKLFNAHAKASSAEVDRTATEQARWEQAVEDTQRRSVLASADLIRLLRLDPHLIVVPAEDKVIPIALFDDSFATDSLIAQGLTSRPELAQHDAVVDAALRRLRQEKVRPWLPNVQLGASSGHFGGGPSDATTTSGGRLDLDVAAVWELRNLGFGNIALRRQRASQMRQAVNVAEQWRDRITSEIIKAHADVISFRRQIKTALDRVKASGASYRSNFQRIREEGEGLPIELLDAIRSRTEAQDAYTRAVTDYNRAQYRLLRAVGQPPGVLDNEEDEAPDVEVIPPPRA